MAITVYVYTTIMKVLKSGFLMNGKLTVPSQESTNTSMKTNLRIYYKLALSK